MLSEAVNRGIRVYLSDLWTPGTVRYLMLRRILLVSSIALSSGPGIATTFEEQRALFLQADKALARGRSDDARQLAESLSDYPLQPYLLYRILKREPTSEPEIIAFLDQHGQTRFAGPLRRKLLATLEVRGSWDDYVRYYRKTKDTETRCTYFFALRQLGRISEADAGTAHLWAEAQPAGMACRRLFAAWQAGPTFGPEVVWKRFAAALEKGRIGVAEELQHLLPTGQQDTAALWLRVHKEPGLVAECALLQPENPRHGPIFAHGIYRWAAKDPGRAQSVWSLRRSGFRIDDDRQNRVDRRLGLALATERNSDASAYLSAIPDTAADSRTRAWRIRAALGQEDWPAVFAALARISETEKKETGWRYWQARALEALGESSMATEILDALAGERDFFGFIAADRIGRDYPLSFTPAPVPASEIRTLRSREAFRAIDEFRVLNRPGEAQKEWMHTLETLPPKDMAVAAELARQWNWHRLAILTLAKAHLWDNLPLRFPLAYSETIVREAGVQRLDPALVFGIVRRESAFDPYAKSSANALGLMQLLPSTGREVARKLGEIWGTERTLLRPAMNVRLGTAYLRGLMDRFGEHPALAAAAYNAGSGRAARWLPKGKPMPADIWIETIPFDETRRYVSAVLSYAVIYREQLGGRTLRISELLAKIKPGSETAPTAAPPTPASYCRNPAGHTLQ